LAARELPASVRDRFPIFKRKVYVNSCSQGALSDSVRVAYLSYLDDWDERGAPWEYWVELMEAARAEFAGWSAPAWTRWRSRPRCRRA